MSQGIVVWITGRPASGKSTFGGLLAGLLRADGVPCALLDGDEIREALGRPAGRGREERDAFYEARHRRALITGASLARQRPHSRPKRPRRELHRGIPSTEGSRKGAKPQRAVFLCAFASLRENLPGPGQIRRLSGSEPHPARSLRRRGR